MRRRKGAKKSQAKQKFVDSKPKLVDAEDAKKSKRGRKENQTGKLRRPPIGEQPFRALIRIRAMARITSFASLLYIDQTWSTAADSERSCRRARIPEKSRIRTPPATACRQGCCRSAPARRVDWAAGATRIDDTLSIRATPGIHCVPQPGRFSGWPEPA